MKKKLVVFTGAGMSEESGLQTFRGMDGLWNNYDIRELATPEGWEKNPALVLRFYNERLRQVRNVLPNLAHYKLAELEKKFNVFIITQNIDDLHERAGSCFILHLHGEIMKSRSSIDPCLIYDVKDKIRVNDTCKKGSPLRPHVVWFGEDVPLFTEAQEIAQTADILLVVGTSLTVYPAANLVYSMPKETPVYVIDPNVQLNSSQVTTIKTNAVEGMKIFSQINFESRKE